MNRELLIFASAVWLSGCSLVTKAVEPPYFPVLPPSTYGGKATWQQTMHLAYGADETNLISYASVTPERISVRGFSAMGQRLFSIEYDGQAFHVDASKEYSRHIPAKRIIGDLQQAYWPLAALQQGLAGSEWTASEPRAGLRTIRHDGALYAQIHVSESGHQLWLTNLAQDYVLDISSVEVE